MYPYFKGYEGKEYSPNPQRRFGFLSPGRHHLFRITGCFSVFIVIFAAVMQLAFLLTLVFCATVHLVITCTLALYSRYKVQYLSLTWIMGIFCAEFCAAIPFSFFLSNAAPGMLHPVMLLSLVACSFLQSLYPLSICMPGYLQWGRMWKYATPALVLIALYVLGMLMGSRPVIVHNGKELLRHLLSGDILMRAAALALSLYYIVNIFRLPHILVKTIDLPRYLIGYGTAMGLSAVFYVVLTIRFQETLLIAYLLIFTALNLYMFFRTLETMAINLPKPKIETVTEAPTPEVIEQAEREDFNEANRQRFHRVEYFMQNEREWTDNTFGRDRLCEATGINRHLLLQCLRSQGYNNIHDYINYYRMEELKRRILRGEITTLNGCTDTGFGSVKTARSCFERMEPVSLDDFLKNHLKPRKEEA